MVQPFRVSDGDDPGRNLGGWSDEGDVDVPGTLTVDTVRGSGNSPAQSTTTFAGQVSFDQQVSFEQVAAAAATFTGVVTVDGANFLVLGDGKGYRFRPLGTRLDTEATGSDWIFSVFSGTDFDGTQNTYLRLESGAALAHAIGTWIFTATADSAAVHTLDGAANAGAGALGFYGAAPAAKPNVTGSRGGNAALTSLLTALATLGLITNGTTA